MESGSCLLLLFRPSYCIPATLAWTPKLFLATGHLCF